MSEEIRSDMTAVGLWAGLHQIDLQIMMFGTGWKIKENTLIHHTGEEQYHVYCTSSNAAELVTDELLQELTLLLPDEDAYVDLLVQKEILQVLQITKK